MNHEDYPYHGPMGPLDIGSPAAGHDTAADLPALYCLENWKVLKISKFSAGALPSPRDFSGQGGGPGGPTSGCPPLILIRRRDCNAYGHHICKGLVTVNEACRASLWRISYVSFQNCKVKVGTFILVSALSLFDIRHAARFTTVFADLDLYDSTNYIWASSELILACISMSEHFSALGVM